MDSMVHLVALNHRRCSYKIDLFSVCLADISRSRAKEAPDLAAVKAKLSWSSELVRAGLPDLASN
jgi:hypothetical protein